MNEISKTMVLGVGAAACLVSVFVNLLAREFARRIGLVDRPDGHRKLQTQAIPLAGGMAIFVSVLLILGALVLYFPEVCDQLMAHPAELLGLLSSSSIIVLLGILDDFVGLRGRQKFLGQILAAGVLVSFGICIRQVSIFGYTFHLEYLAVPFTIFWLVGAINALNLLDGIDGLAATLGGILSGAIAIAAYCADHQMIAVIAAALCGSLLGFLRYNLPPASMYLGDAGSMLIGLTVGVMAIQASLKESATVLLAFPLSLWTIPIFDSTAAILRRKLTGRSIYTTDRAHMHHHLLSRFGHRRALACIGGVALLTSSAALLGVLWRSDLISLVCSLAVVVMFVVLKVFGHAEWQLAMVKVRSLLRSLFLSHAIHPGAAWGEAVRLQGTRQWGLIWDQLTECALLLELLQIQLDVNVPTLGEGYHASWRRPTALDNARHWKLELPLVLEGRVMGFVKIVGERTHDSAEHFERLMEVMEDVESRLKSLTKVDVGPLSHRVSLPVPQVVAGEHALPG